MFCFEICTPVGEGEKREGVQIFKKAHRTFDILDIKFLAP